MMVCTFGLSILARRRDGQADPFSRAQAGKASAPVYPSSIGRVRNKDALSAVATRRRSRLKRPFSSVPMTKHVDDLTRSAGS
jgi:hypothetical protein